MWFWNFDFSFLRASQLYGVTWWTRVDHSDKLQNEDDGDRSFQMRNGDFPTDDETSSRDTRKDEEDDDEDSDDEEGRCQRWVNAACGMPKAQAKNKQTAAITLNERRSFLIENPRWEAILNINAALGLSVMAFLIGYYR
ncbi:solute carrier family 5 member 4 [Aplysia californica]|uniref:Solute carrier family 5 member 4 n=1 Tax=Aplysia californica TaxID=6500 RepID=A0ABM1AB46_APLCA|nr:solute carrier family 5 member 4 [Aplysia californica]